jgi:hypothetical protein
VLFCCRRGRLLRDLAEAATVCWRIARWDACGGPNTGPEIKVHTVMAATHRNCMVRTSLKAWQAAMPFHRLTRGSRFNQNRAPCRCNCYAGIALRARPFSPSYRKFLSPLGMRND